MNEEECKKNFEKHLLNWGQKLIDELEIAPGEAQTSNDIWEHFYEVLEGQTTGTPEEGLANDLLEMLSKYSSCSLEPPEEYKSQRKFSLELQEKARKYNIPFRMVMRKSALIEAVQEAEDEVKEKVKKV